MGIYQDKIEGNKISIIVPVYNAEMYLHKCIESILNQTYSNFELILIDDDSKDESLKICQEATAKDPRIKVIHKENAGVSAARNLGLDIAEGDYIGFVDSDDWIAPNMYEELMLAIKQQEAECVMCETVKAFDEYEVVLHVNNSKKMHMLAEEACAELCVPAGNTKNDFNYWVVWNKLYKREVWGNLRFDETLKNAEDRWALFQIYSSIKKFAVCNKALYYYRQNEGLSASKNRNRKFDYIVGHRMLQSARKKGWDLQPYIETVIVHTAGLGRACLKNNDKESYISMHKDLKKVWCDVKKVLPVAKKIYISVLLMFRYFPRVTWIIMTKKYN